MGSLWLQEKGSSTDSSWVESEEYPPESKAFWVAPIQELTTIMPGSSRRYLPGIVQTNPTKIEMPTHQAYKEFRMYLSSIRLSSTADQLFQNFPHVLMPLFTKFIYHIFQFLDISISERSKSFQIKQ